MIRFRAGNRQGAGSTPGAYSETTSPVARILAASSAWDARVVAVDPAAEHGDGRAAGLERAAVGLAVDAARKAADDDEPGRGELAAEHPRDLRAVGGAASARRRRRPQRAPSSSSSARAAHEQARRRIVDRAAAAAESRQSERASQRTPRRCSPAR